MTLVEKFKNGEFYVHCDTEEKARKFVKWCYDNDIYWFVENKSGLETYYGDYGCNTVYVCNRYAKRLMYANKDDYVKDSDTVISFDEFMKEVDGVKEFTKSDLEVGMFVKLRDGKVFLVLESYEELYLTSTSGYYSNLKNFNENLTNKNYRGSDIVSIYLPKKADYLSYHLIGDNLELIWEREEVKELTMEDIEKIVGCKVKIVK